jgi:uncharacterized membrane protein YeaQ/YmgE (transglycosylase-associated protein family)
MTFLDGVTQSELPDGSLRRDEMSILAWIVVGIIAGFLAKSVLPGKAPGGITGDLIIGVVGAVLGGWIMNTFGSAGVSGINLWSIFVAFVGASVLLVGLRTVTGNRAAR